MDTQQIKLKRSTIHGTGTGWEFLRDLNNRLGEPAAVGHNTWFANKSVELDDPQTPFLGFGPSRLRFSALTLRQALEIAKKSDKPFWQDFLAKRGGVNYSEPQLDSLVDPQDNRDVYHHLFKPFADLADQRHIGKNKLPFWTAINMLTACFGGQRMTMAQLEAGVNSLLEPKNVEDSNNRFTLSVMLHVAWGAGEIVYGADPSNNPDLIPFDGLTAPVKAIDDDSVEPILEYILKALEAKKAALSK